MNVIENEKQLAITKEWVVKFAQSVKFADEMKEGDPILRKLIYDSHKSMLYDLLDQIEVYEKHHGFQIGSDA
jgi:hypothetical protein